MTDSSKSMKHHKSAENADRISDLPDPVLCHILSFLPTKVAVLTSILSKRWRLLWTSVPVLDFHYKWSLQGRYEEPKSFIRLVNMVLILRDRRPIKKFCLKCDYLAREWVLFLDTWVNAAIRFKAEHLELSFACLQKFKLPPCFLTCRTLVVLKMEGLHLPEINSSVQFPLLKTLTFSLVTFERSEDIINFFSGCPLLEKLVTKHTMINPLRVSAENYKPGIYFPNLVEAVVEVDYCGRMLFKALYNAKCLSLLLGNSILWFINNYLGTNIQKFHNLTHLELSYQKLSWIWLKIFLENSPELKFLTLRKVRSHNYGNSYRWTHPPHVPECVKLHLKEICFRGYEGSGCDLELARYILENARALEVMTIYIDDNLNALANLEIVGSLSAFSRISATSKLLFC